jgi:hypothetical protein
MRIPLTYFQTLVEFFDETAPARNDDGDENGDVVSVDVDDLVRKSQRSGFGVE